MLQTTGSVLSSDEPCEDVTLSLSKLLSSCVCFNLRSGTEVLQLAADRVVCCQPSTLGLSPILAPITTTT